MDLPLRSPLALTFLLASQGESAFQGNTAVLANALAVTGAHIGPLTLFSLGLGPWMVSVVLWRFLTAFGAFKQLSQSQAEAYRLFLSLIVASLQAIASLRGLVLSPTYSVFGLFFMQGLTVVTLVAGSFVLTWLSNLNSQKGLGGMTVIILANMLLSLGDSIWQYFANQNLTLSQLVFQVALGLLGCLCLIYVAGILYRAEYRIPILRIGVNTPYHEASYLPIRVTPAGAMPFMYGMTLMLFPLFVIQALAQLFPYSGLLDYLARHLSLTEWSGVLCYIVLLYVLSLGFAYYNYDANDLAKTLRKNGDYIASVAPGLATRQFIQSKVTALAQFGALVVLMVGGVPLLYGVLQGNDPQTILLSILIGDVFMLAGFFLDVIEQVTTLRNWRRYHNPI
ncbi:accessory Sec system protein translocase subunit SecY2 [Streptococcus sp. DD12]|uniref:accessory Sec system protein translocase subunit SecY2 n=1 Tax=Streptococcus sp. DD12 TaxID=1777880 RepID=UPI000798F06B|nr:accessory Sec system protein translocase subunit SecY2 [Streptococcus sp. DD12]KXT76465.1 hypothetical protein STRDD12_00544 [Streptococcus sp. DD12]